MDYRIPSLPLDREELSSFLPPADVALLMNWKTTNARRATLIAKQTDKLITSEESAELEHLQELAGIMRTAGMARSYAHIEEMEKELALRDARRPHTKP